MSWVGIEQGMVELAAWLGQAAEDRVETATGELAARGLTTTAKKSRGAR